MDLIINLIGIITLSCGGPMVVGQPDPCIANFPKAIQVFIPDGRFHPTVCKTGNTVDPYITVHEAYIRVRGAAATASPAWPGAIQCDDDSLGRPCVLYPVVKRRIDIDGVTDGSGVSDINFNGHGGTIRWRALMPNLVLADRNVLARMNVRNGRISYHRVVGTNGMIGARITVPGLSGNRIIRATNSVGNELRLTVPERATIDIMNLPPALARAKVIADHAHDDDCDHFFLHYSLNLSPPPQRCVLPPGSCEETDDHKKAPSAGATVACSNSNYP